MSQGQIRARRLPALNFRLDRAAMDRSNQVERTPVVYNNET